MNHSCPPLLRGESFTLDSYMRADSMNTVSILHTATFYVVVSGYFKHGFALSTFDHHEISSRSTLFPPQQLRGESFTLDAYSFNQHSLYNYIHTATFCMQGIVSGYFKHGLLRSLLRFVWCIVIMRIEPLRFSNFIVCN